MHTDPGIAIKIRGTTATFLCNIFESNPEDIDHPKMIRRYLESKNGKLSYDYSEYRLAMLAFIIELASKK